MKFSKLIFAFSLICLSFATQAQVGIGTNSPAASAKLEVSSTTQGFLPPRMTNAQKNAIQNPAAGLVLWCTDCGTEGELHVYTGSSWINLGERICFNDVYNRGANWFSQQYSQLQAAYPNWTTECNFGILLSPTSSGMPLYNDASEVIFALDNYKNSGIDMSYGCLYNSTKNYQSSLSCTNVYITEGINGFDAVNYATPSGSGVVIIRGTGINAIRGITIPSTFTNVIFRVSGIDCTYNITYNPNKTTVTGTPSGMRNILNLITDTNL
jgi:hypothetical protein